jgi:membrane fusion protein (multidrug efflux system)
VDDADVAAEAAGAVEQVLAERGDIVKAGSPLFALDRTNSELQAREAAASVASAEAQVRLAESECARARSLADAGGMSTAERDRVLTQCEQGARQLEAAKARKALVDTNLARATVRAPFAGVVADRLVSPGEYVTPGRTVARLVAIDPLRLELSVPEREASRVRVGAPIRFEVSDPVGVVVEATVDRISPALRDRTRDLVIEASVPNPDGKLRPNSFALARVGVDPSPGVVVPAEAVLAKGDTARVFVVVNDNAEERVVELGDVVEGGVELRSGVASGEVVVSPIPKGLADGAALAVQ